jgi:hypothetical protein
MKKPDTSSACWNLPAFFTALCFASGAGSTLAQTNIVLVDATLSGALTWTAPPYLGTFTVEWAPTVTGPWTNSWAPLSSIPNTGALCAAQLPVFYRVLGRPYPGILLHGEGTNGSTAILDAQGHAVTVLGNARIASTNSYFGSGSIDFDGNGDYLNLGISSDWALGAGDFTVDLWANFYTNTVTLHLIGLHTQGLFTDWSLLYEGSALRFYISGVATTYSWTPTLGRWYHLAVTRSAGTVRLFVDGKVVKTATDATNISNSRALTIGAAINPNLFFSGLLDEVHIVKGRAMWTQDFMPPTEPYGF